MNWIKVIFFIAAILILNEAIIETDGILLIGNDADWITIKNTSFLIMDLFLGIGILFSIFLSKSSYPKGINLAIILLAIIFHAGKAIEYIINPAIAYCYYPEMFWMNNLTLALLLIALGLVYIVQAVKINLNHL